MPKQILRPKNLSFQPRPTYPYSPGAKGGHYLFTAGQVGWNDKGELVGIGDVRDVVMVTASEGGVLSAQRAGARLIVGVLSDVDDAGRLRRAGATHLLADVGDLPDLVASQGGITTSD